MSRASHTESAPAEDVAAGDGKKHRLRKLFLVGVLVAGVTAVIRKIRSGRSAESGQDT